jgi:hypothetical protein
VVAIPSVLDFTGRLYTRSMMYTNRDFLRKKCTLLFSQKSVFCILIAILSGLFQVLLSNSLAIPNPDQIVQISNANHFSLKTIQNPDNFATIWNGEKERLGPKMTSVAGRFICLD